MLIYFILSVVSYLTTLDLRDPLYARVSKSAHLGFLLAFPGGGSQCLDSIGVALRLESHLGLCYTPRYRSGRRQVVTALFVPCSPPRSDVLITVVQVAVGSPSHPFMRSFPSSRR